MGCRTFLKYGAACGWLLLVGCQSYFYYPSKQKLFDPAKILMAPEDVYLRLPSGEEVHGWYFSSTSSEPSKGTLLFFHGNAENISSHFLMFHWLPGKGYNYFIFDYPGYGKSTGKPMPQNTVEAGKEAARWLFKNKDQRPLFIYGHSLGGAIALRVAEDLKDEVPLGAVIVDGSFSSYQKMSREVLSRAWWASLLKPFTYVLLSDKYAVKSLADLSPTPLLFIHGDGDTVIAMENSERMYKEAKEPKELWIVPGGGHGNLYEVNSGQLREQLLSFLSRSSTVSK